MFRISKIYNYESNSQRTVNCIDMKGDVQNIKDIQLWKQFTTILVTSSQMLWCSEYQRYTIMKAIHNRCCCHVFICFDVQNIKDIQLWKQFTTARLACMWEIRMFRISKIYNYESNSQQYHQKGQKRYRCSEYQRYTIMKAIHN